MTTETTTLRIKHMVCPRCIKVVREELEKLGLEVLSVQLGEAIIQNTSPSVTPDAIRQCLEKEGFALLEDRQAVLVENVKMAIIQLIHSGAIEHLKENFSEFVASAVQKDYHTISVTFSALEGITIEKYFILQKIERAKELLSYGELSLSELARKLSYSSIAHFSNQFKQITGISPNQYRKNRLAAQDRKSIDGI